MMQAANLNAIGMEGLASAGNEDLLPNLAIAAFFPKIASDVGHAPHDCGSAVISGVRDYIQAHAAEVPEMSVVASLFGISMRAMQENFRRQHGFSPREYLIGCRLDGAHQSLLMTERTQSIFDLAMKFGFSEHKHFSVKYRDKCGKSPSETLRGAMKLDLDDQTPGQMDKLAVDAT